jgi:hypothetical protein
MKPYFEQMADFGKELKKSQIKRTEENIQQVKEIEAGIAEKNRRKYPTGQRN